MKLGRTPVGACLALLVSALLTFDVDVAQAEVDCGVEASLTSSGYEICEQGDIAIDRGFADSNAGIGFSLPPLFLQFDADPSNMVGAKNGLAPPTAVITVSAQTYNPSKVLSSSSIHVLMGESCLPGGLDDSETLEWEGHAVEPVEIEVGEVGEGSGRKLEITFPVPSTSTYYLVIRSAEYSTRAVSCWLNVDSFALVRGGYDSDGNNYPSCTTLSTFNVTQLYTQAKSDWMRGAITRLNIADLNALSVVSDVCSSRTLWLHYLLRLSTAYIAINWTIAGGGVILVLFTIGTSVAFSVWNRYSKAVEFRSRVISMEIVDNIRQAITTALNERRHYFILRHWTTRKGFSQLPWIGRGAPLGRVYLRQEVRSRFIRCLTTCLERSIDDGAVVEVRHNKKEWEADVEEEEDRKKRRESKVQPKSSRQVQTGGGSATTSIAARSRRRSVGRESLFSITPFEVEVSAVTLEDVLKDVYESGEVAELMTEVDNDMKWRNAEVDEQLYQLVTSSSDIGSGGEEEGKGEGGEERGKEEREGGTREEEGGEGKEEGGGEGEGEGVKAAASLRRDEGGEVEA
uniref:Uncharacterized protein n=1 Tax=Palpitomonas bilix TaxID=652834 RepID=A0A7S3DEV2_9EUKA